MKILLISTSDIRGGAAIAAYRLMNALNAQGQQAKMVVREKLSDNENVIQLGSALPDRWNFLSERAHIFAQNRFSRKHLFDVSTAESGLAITKHPLFREADLIHLHWINQGTLSLKELGRILASGKKVIWTMHDMWSFTGICHHAAGCSHYESGCGHCPYLAKPSGEDLSYRRFLTKQQRYAAGEITFVACSNWLKNLAEKSPLTRDHNLVSIPNPIDTNQYAPQDKQQIRRMFNLPEHAKIVLFAAVNTSDSRKGMDYLAQADRILARQSHDILFLIAGERGSELGQHLSQPSRSIGLVNPDQMALVYNAADLFVTPSLQENLPNTLMEAMACGTPCVGFDTGGIPEMITHKQNGYVARFKDADDLSAGIEQMLFSCDLASFSSDARSKVIREYSQEKIVNRYLEIYGTG